MAAASLGIPSNHLRTVRRIRLETFGCRANKYDSALLRGALLANGYEIAAPDEPFDVLILNTCTVTGAADKATHRLLRRYRRHHPDAQLIITGCYAAVATSEVRNSLEVDLVLPDRDPALLVGQLDAFLGHTQSDTVAADPVPDPGHYSRFFFKVQDGCNIRCTFCIIPAARGPSRSLPVDDVISTVRQSCDRGYRETILSGINLGAYGRDLPQRPTLARLITRIFHETPLERLRLGSLEPWSIRRDLIELMGVEPRLMPSLHIPLQSGALPILKAMKRPSTPARYRSLVSRLQSVRPGLTLWLDVLVGFPGETESLFEECFQFVSGLNFTRLHVFPYSPRAGTPAADRPDQVPEPVKRERVLRLLALSRERFTATLHSRIGSCDEMLVENDGKGHTRDNLPVQLRLGSAQDPETHKGRILPILIDRVQDEQLVAVARI